MYGDVFLSFPTIHYYTYRLLLYNVLICVLSIAIQIIHSFRAKNWINIGMFVGNIWFFRIVGHAILLFQTGQKAIDSIPTYC